MVTIFPTHADLSKLEINQESGPEGSAVASNYEGICEENRRRYGTEGAQKSGGLAAKLYDNRTHFIFELLQNAEDALGRRGALDGSRKVTFTLNATRLMLSHFGKPFDEADVRSVCDISESTKNEPSIGRFGLGFKSVYNITDAPEIHSGEEAFSIEDYVFPKRIPRLHLHPEETQIILPLRPQDASAGEEITSGFRQLGPNSLLFLRNIEEINWSVEGCASGWYLRNTPEELDANVNRITVIGYESSQDEEVDQTWLVFHRDVFTEEKKRVGRVEVAFSLTASKDSPKGWSVQPLPTSPLVVFFPTVVETHLGFLAQGPYRTTPSREAIPPNDPWNQHLVSETSILLLDAMRWMRDKSMLDVAALRCLPLDRAKFPQGARFAPMFEAVRKAIKEEPLLPAYHSGHVSADHAMLARTNDIRVLFSPEQASALFSSSISAWLSSEITQDKATDIRRYLMNELQVEEITPTKLIPHLTKSFLEAQADDWVARLYEFLSGHEAALRGRLSTVPLVRVEDGSHVVARSDRGPNAFLPSNAATDFTTVRRAVCATAEARAFLRSLGIAEPDPVDDVILNLLPKYRDGKATIQEGLYAADIDRIRAAAKTDSSAQSERLKAALRQTSFVKTADTGSRKSPFAKPCEVYIATDRLQQLFENIPSILIVDDNSDCLASTEIRDLLVSCGASRYLSPQPVSTYLTPSEKLRIRRDAGLERASRENSPEDFTLRGLKQVLDYLPNLEPESAAIRAKLLWEALADLEGRNRATFHGSYEWSFFHEKKTGRFDAAFVRMLNEDAWIPSTNGELVRPSLVEFDTLGWTPNPFLLTKIAFKPPVLDQLAKEAGIDPAILELLRRDPAIVAELASRLRSKAAHEPSPSNAPSIQIDEEDNDDVCGDAQDLYNDDMPGLLPAKPAPENGNGEGRRGRQGDQGRANNAPPRVSGQNNVGGNGRSEGKGASGGKAGTDEAGQESRRAGHAGARPFISYVSAHPEDEATDPDGLEQAVRMQIEAQALDLIIRLEPKLQRTPEGNPGFDLYEADSSGNRIRWIEVKSMTGSLDDRPVGISHTQFKYALEKRDAYWLYVVEYASDPARANVIRIQNPAGQSSTFTFDHGWRRVACTETPTFHPDNEMRLIAPAEPPGCVQPHTGQYGGSLPPYPVD